MVRSVLAAAVLFLALPAVAQTTDEVIVARTLDAFIQATLAADHQKLESMAAPEITYGHSDGRVQDRATFIKGIGPQAVNFKKIESTKQTISVQGDVAIVRNHFAGDFDRAGTANHVELEVIYVWQKRGGDWKLILRQAYKL